jgi:hypothetical protein
VGLGGGSAGKGGAAAGVGAGGSGRGDFYAAGAASTICPNERKNRLGGLVVHLTLARFFGRSEYNRLAQT